VLKVRKVGDKRWQESPMTQGDNDRWYGEFHVTAIGRWEYTIEAYAERYLSWADEISKKNVPVPTSPANCSRAGDPQEVGRLGRGEDRAASNDLIAAMESALAAGEQQGADRPGHRQRHAQHDGLLPRSQRGLRTGAALNDHGQPAGHPLCRLVRVLSAFAGQHAVPAWHPAGQHPSPARDQGDGLRRRLSAADPSHRPQFPQGQEQQPDAVQGDVGSPWAIGNEHGGHMALEPQLGTWDDWDQFVATCRELGSRLRSIT
jgi:starch synthase (maltosyl-transferring)